MTPKIRNIIIFVIIASIFISIYFFFIKGSSDNQDNLILSPSNATLPSLGDSGTNKNISNETSFIAKDFLTLLLNVKNIKLDDAILSDPAFNSLHDSSIVLIPDGTEGRPNPFAQFGTESTLPPLPPPPIPTNPMSANP